VGQIFFIHPKTFKKVDNKEMEIITNGDDSNSTRKRRIHKNR
jgi:hypothetical protein